jgi:hypothetical protein
MVRPRPSVELQSSDQSCFCNSLWFSVVQYSLRIPAVAVVASTRRYQVHLAPGDVDGTATACLTRHALRLQIEGRPHAAEVACRDLVVDRTELAAAIVAS